MPFSIHLLTYQTHLLLYSQKIDLIDCALKYAKALHKFISKFINFVINYCFSSSLPQTTLSSTKLGSNALLLFKHFHLLHTLF